MTNKGLQEVMARIEAWPKERQEAAARVLMDMEEQNDVPHQLSDEHVAEVERRRKNPNRKFMTLKQVRNYFAQRRA